MSGQLRIGTSGWNYKHWRDVFYPPDVPVRRWLPYYSEHFNTAEVNYSFYRLPKVSTYEKWLDEVPADFLFTLKCSRLITNNKRLGNLGDLWENFVSNAVVLGDRLGPILFQFPENFEKDAPRLSDFLAIARDAVPGHRTGRQETQGRRRPAGITQGPELRLAMEFRHQSWFDREIYRLLEKHNVALVAADSSQFPREDRVTADFAYFRYHGPGRLFGSRYTDRQIAAEAEKISKLQERGLDVLAYFNNDGHGYAVDNALSLKRHLEPPALRRKVVTG